MVVSAGVQVVVAFVKAQAMLSLAGFAVSRCVQSCLQPHSPLAAGSGECPVVEYVDMLVSKSWCLDVEDVENLA